MSETPSGVADEVRSGRGGLRGGAARYVAFLLLAPAAISYTAARFWLTSGDLHSAATALGESFLVAAVLGICGDFYLRYRLSEASEKKGAKRAIAEMFGFLDPNQPPELQDAVSEFANEKMYVRQACWRISFTWEDPEKRDVLKVEIELQQAGCSIAKGGLRFHRPVWILRSVDGFSSTYTRYALHSTSSDVRVDADEQSVEPYCWSNDGRAFLDTARLIADTSPSQVIPYMNKFSALMRARMYRHPTDYVPLAHGSFTLACDLELSGPALEELTVSAFTPKRSQPADQEWVFRAGEGDPRKFTWYNVTPNQTTIVSWRRPSSFSGM